MSAATMLTPDEMLLGATHGLHRRFNKLQRGRKEREQGKRSTWDNEIEGACAELAFCKINGFYWDGLGEIRTPDGGEFQVRWTGHENGGLIVYAHDEGNRIFVLMGGWGPRYHIVGCMRGAAGKKSCWMTEDGFYLVPRQYLRPPRPEAQPIRA